MSCTCAFHVCMYDAPGKRFRVWFMSTLTQFSWRFLETYQVYEYLCLHARYTLCSFLVFMSGWKSKDRLLIHIPI